MELRFEDKISICEREFFTYDKPVPFKNGLSIHPARVKDYSRFYSIISCFTVEKDNELDGLGLLMTELEFVFHMIKQGNEVFKSQFIGGLEMAFDIENGLFCDDKECENYKKIDTYSNLQKQVAEINKELLEEFKDPESALLKKAKEKKMYELQLCPCCKKMRRDVIEFKEQKRNENSDEMMPILTVWGEDISEKEYEDLKRIYCYQNLPDYDDSYIDPELKAGLEEASRLRGGKTEQPTLERQIICVAISTGYTPEQINELTIRKFTQYLRVADAKLTYLAYKIGELSGLVTFKTPIPHWIYTKDDARKSLLDNIMSVEQVEKKIQG